MLEWLLASIDPSRDHYINQAISWHGRLMVSAWGILAPLAVLSARFFKVTPRQKWPQELDNATWWRSHWIGQTAVFLFTIVGIYIVVDDFEPAVHPHGILGYLVLVGVSIQVLFGIFRGSKGGPTAPGRDGTLHGDHYNMTPRRQLFEQVHKTLGYATIALAAATILFGLWITNSPRYFFIVILGFWVLLTIVFAVLQRLGWAIDTYQAIWGPDPIHPGNRRASPGWGMRTSGIKDESHH